MKCTVECRCMADRLSALLDQGVVESGDFPLTDIISSLRDMGLQNRNDPALARRR